MGVICHEGQTHRALLILHKQMSCVGTRESIVQTGVQRLSLTMVYSADYNMYKQCMKLFGPFFLIIAGSCVIFVYIFPQDNGDRCQHFGQVYVIGKGEN